jgi:PAS domain S-box-containing protein
MRRSLSLRVLLAVSLITVSVFGAAGAGHWRFGVAAAAATVAGLLLGFALLSRMVLGPVRALAEQATRLASGDLRARSGFAAAAAGDDADELTRLGRALDVMAERITVDLDRLAESEERYREMVDNAADGIFTTAADGSLLDVNPFGCALVRRPRHEVIGRSVADFLDPTQREDAGRIIESLQPGQNIVREWRMLLPDGSFRPVEVNTKRFADGRMVGITRDITDRKRAENELRRLVSLQRTIAELGQQALRETDLQAILAEAARRVAAALDAPIASIVELMPDESWLPRVAVGWESGLSPGGTFPATDVPQACYTLQSDAAVVVEDLRVETRFPSTSLARAYGIVSGITVLIRGSEKRPFGVLGVHAFERRHFTADDVHFVEAVASILAQSIARAGIDDALRVSELRYRHARCSAPGHARRHLRPRHGHQPGGMERGPDAAVRSRTERLSHHGLVADAAPSRRQRADHATDRGDHRGRRVFLAGAIPVPARRRRLRTSPRSRLRRVCQ